MNFATYSTPSGYVNAMLRMPGTLYFPELVECLLNLDEGRAAASVYLGGFYHGVLSR